MLLLIAAGCATPPMRSVAALPADLPRFGDPVQPRGVARSNANLAEDFMSLMFRLESGETVPVLLKYDGPVRVALRTPGLETYRPELDALLRRLRAEAGVDIGLTADPDLADIHIQAVSRRDIQRAFPGAACFIVPNVKDWESFRRPALRSGSMLWSRQVRLGTTSIFIPADSTPQDTRDCLHEEMAQALGPANDVFRIADTVFNDDNFHSVLTRFDMLMLRILYDPVLRSGMTPNVVAAQLPALLDRLNPAGRNLPPQPRAAENPVWKRAIERALDINTPLRLRVAAAQVAVAEADAMFPQDHRLGLSLLTLGRVMVEDDPQTAGQLFDAAYARFRGAFGASSIHASRAAFHRALFALGEGDPVAAQRIAKSHLAGARAAQNAVILSGLYAVAAEAGLAIGDRATARQDRIASLRWARYAFGDADGMLAAAAEELLAVAGEIRP